MLKIFISVLFLFIFCSNKTLGQLPVISSQDSCIRNIKDYSNYWKKDKKGENGFRELLGVVIKKCDLTGIKWDEVKSYLGTPNQKFKLENTWTYRYNLNFVIGPAHIGEKYLDVDVDPQGFITAFNIYEIDG